MALAPQTELVILPNRARSRTLDRPAPFSSLSHDVLYILLRDAASRATEEAPLTPLFSLAHSSRTIYEVYRFHHVALLRTVLETLTDVYSPKCFGYAVQIAERDVLPKSLTMNKSSSPWTSSREVLVIASAIKNHRGVLAFTKAAGFNYYSVISGQFKLTKTVETPKSCVDAVYQFAAEGFSEECIEEIKDQSRSLSEAAKAKACLFACFNRIDVILWDRIEHAAAMENFLLYGMTASLTFNGEDTPRPKDESIFKHFQAIKYLPGYWRLLAHLCGTWESPLLMTQSDSNVLDDYYSYYSANVQLERISERWEDVKAWISDHERWKDLQKITGYTSSKKSELSPSFLSGMLLPFLPYVVSSIKRSLKERQRAMEDILWRETHRWHNLGSSRSERVTGSMLTPQTSIDNSVLDLEKPTVSMSNIYRKAPTVIEPDAQEAAESRPSFFDMRRDVKAILEEGEGKDTGKTQ